MKLPRILVALVVAMLPAVTAPATAAGSSWFQSVGRASESAPCPDPSFGTPWQDDWDPTERPWRPSWGQWMNGGAGGWTCDRQITWDRGPGGAGCLLFDDASVEVYYVDFRGGWSIGVGPRYVDASCTVLYRWGGTPGSTAPIDLFLVYAPDLTVAVERCRQAFGLPPTGVSPAGSNGVWMCALVPG